jgi:acyl carrier protein
VNVDFQSILSRVPEILKAEFPALRAMDLAPDTPLLSAGLLDSFAVITLISALESAFNISVDVERMEIGQFESPSTIARLCCEAMAAGGGAPHG